MLLNTLHCRGLAWAVLAASLLMKVAGAEEPTTRVPETYPLEYPVAEQFCPPIRSTFYEVTRDMVMVRGKTIRQKPNGGYGLPVIDKLGDKHLIHVGADLGWQQVGEPVFAVANGVVRLSSGPELKQTREDSSRANRAGHRQNDLAWGNVVVIEHKLADGAGYVTTIYGHLNSKRFVTAGQIVTAGQPIGTIGRQHPRINGGYKPHLHFGVRKGRLVEEGTALTQFVVNGRAGKIIVKSLGEREVEVAVDVQIPPGAFDGFMIQLNGQPFKVRSQDDQLMVSARALWHCPALALEVVGYDLSVELWNDPVAFLRQQGADRRPAPFRSLQ